MRCQLRGGGDGGQGHLRNHNRTLKMSPAHPIVLLSITFFLILMRWRVLILPWWIDHLQRDYWFAIPCPRFDSIVHRESIALCKSKKLHRLGEHNWSKRWYRSLSCYEAYHESLIKYLCHRARGGINTLHMTRVYHVRATALNYRYQINPTSIPKSLANSDQDKYPTLLPMPMHNS